MLKSFKKFTEQKLNLKESDSLLLALSGGIDSVVLAHLLKRTGFSFGIAHCNFQLRGQESDKDAGFSEKLAEELDVPFFSKNFETKKYAKRHKISIQMAARDLRYEWLEQVRSEHSFNFIVTAHHRNDILETVLFNLTKGTGIAGLRGIKPISGHLVRPLLFADKKAIRDFARKKSLKWREDSSNKSVKYSRNLIRKKVVPVLREINPSLEETLESTVERISAVEDIFNHITEKIRNSAVKYATDSCQIDLEPLQAHPSAHVVLYSLLKDYGFNYDQVKDLYYTTVSGKMIESKQYKATMDRNRILVNSKNKKIFSAALYEKDSEVVLDGVKIKSQMYSVKELRISSDPHFAYLDLDLVQFPVTIRSWEQGDHFVPLGMKKKKKLSDLFIDMKIPVAEKLKYPVLTSGEQILWIAGIRIDERYKVTDKTRKVLELRMERSQ